MEQVNQKFEGRIWHNTNTVVATRQIFDDKGKLVSKESHVLSSVEYLALLYQLSVIERPKTNRTYVYHQRNENGLYVYRITQDNSHSKYVYTFDNYLGLNSKD